MGLFYVFIALIITWFAYKEPVPKVKKTKRKKRFLIMWG